MAGWYRTGTVNLTNGSATVAGVGATLWASALRPGMVFTTDFHTLYEIKTVDGDAQITLDRAWAGATATGVAYAVIFGGAAISNAEIVAELMGMVSKWQTREDQYDDWVGGEPDGGPNGDGKYPLTDSKGNTRLVTSPGRLLTLIDDGLLTNVQQVVDMIEDDVAAAQQAADQATAAATTLTAYVTSADQDRQAAEAARDAAATSATNAAASETAAAGSATAAAGSATTANSAATTATGAKDAAVTARQAAETARDTAVGAKDAVLAARDTAVTASSAAVSAKDTAVAAQGAAQASADRATDAKTTAQNASTDSVNAKIAAVAAQVVSEQRRNEASGFADTAKAWATSPVGTPVTSGGFSSYHWAEQSRTYAQQAQVIAGGYMFGAVGDGNASRVSAQAAADVLHLAAGAGMILNFDQATRKVTFSSVARAVASEDPAVTVRLDEAAALAYLGLDRSKIDHGTLANVGAHGHTEIDAHLDDAGIHVPRPGAGDADKLLKATGAGTFTWVKGAGSGIDADKLDGLSWEEGREVPYNTVPEWVKLGTWATGSDGRRLLITAAGAAGYDNSTATDRGGLTVVNATVGNNANAGVANINGSVAYTDRQLFTAVKFKQGGDRFTYDLYVQRNGFAPFNFKVQCNGTWTTALAYTQPDPGADSDTVRAAVNLGRVLTTTDLSENADAGTVVKRDAGGGIVGGYFHAIGGAPGIALCENDGAEDGKRWNMQASNGLLAFQTTNDVWNASANWLEVTRNGNAPNAATFKVPVHTSLSALGTSAGNSVQHGELYSSSGNNDYLRTKLLRTTTGTDWSSATWRIQRTVDVTPQGYIDIGNAVTLGVGGAARLSVPAAGGDVTIDANKIWHAGNFDPNTKAGTAVATVAANGLMSAADKQMLNGATSSATANALVTRDGNGAAAFTGVKVAGSDVVTDSSLGAATRSFKANPPAGTAGLSAVTGGGAASIETQAQGNGATAGPALIAFHRPGAFAAYFGLDTDNEWRVGGWSYGSTSYRLWHEGNQQDVRSTASPTFSGVNVWSDVVVGIGGQATTSKIRLANDASSDFAYVQVGNASDDNGKLRISKWLTTQGELDRMEVFSAVTQFTAGGNQNLEIDPGGVTVRTGLTLPGSFGTNGFYAGTGDGASYTTYNVKEQIWWGKAYTDYSGTVHGYYNARSGGWDVHSGYQTSPNSDGAAHWPSFYASSGAMSSGTYNMALQADNNAGPRLIAFVNGTTRADDGGPNAATIRNDGGKLVLGGVGQATDIVGSSVTVNGQNLAWETISTTTVNTSVSSCAISLPAGYRKFKVVITRCLPATDGAALYMQASVNGPAGPYAGVGNYWYTCAYSGGDGANNSGVYAEGRNGGTWGTMQTSLAARNSDGVWGEIELTWLPNTSLGVNSHVNSYSPNYGGAWLANTGIITAAPANAVAFVFYMPNTTLVNMVAGSITLLGMR